MQSGELKSDVNALIDTQPPELHAEAASDSHDDLAKKVEKQNVEIRALQKEFIDRHRDIFGVLGRRGQVRIVPGSSFVIQFDTPPVIEVGPEDWERMLEGKYSEEQMIWSTAHELGHFIDFMKDPKGMMDNFAYMREKAKRLVTKTRSIWKKALEERGKSLPDYMTDEAIEAFLYKHLHTLYNCLDDVYVNNWVASQVPGRYLPGKGPQVTTIEALYREDLFPENDLAELPKSRQLAYAILRRHMVRDQTTVIGSEIEGILGRPTRIGADSRPLSRHLERLLRPTPSSAAVQHTAGHRYQLIQQYVEPIFWQLFWEDLKTFDPPPLAKPGGPGGDPGGEGQAIPGGGEAKPKPGEAKDEPTPGEGKGEGKPANPWEDINKANPLDPAKLKDFLDAQEKYEAAKAAEDAKPEKLDPIAIERELKIKHDANLAEYLGNLDPEQALAAAREWQELRDAVAPFVRDLGFVFNDLINTVKNQIIIAWETGFKTGRFNINEFIDRYGPYIAAGYDEYGDVTKLINFNELESYDQREFTSRLSLYPNRFVFRLILDRSGSMTGERILQVKQLVVLLYESLKSFEARVNHIFHLQEPFRVDLEVQTFDDAAPTLAKPLGYYGEEERALMIATLAYLVPRGGTQDGQAWENVAASILEDPQWQKDIEAGRAVDIAVEVTDGESQTEKKTKKAVRQYLAVAGKGSAIGLRIDDPPSIPTESETDSAAPDSEEALAVQKKASEIFDAIFQDNGRHVPHPSQLAPIFAELLVEKLAWLQQKIRLEYEQSDEFEESP